MTDLKYNNPESDFLGENMMLYAPDDYYDEEGKLLVKKGDLLCSDTIRSWFPTPLYKVYIVDQSAEENMNANQFNGATKGKMYLTVTCICSVWQKLICCVQKLSSIRVMQPEQLKMLMKFVAVPMLRRCLQR